MARMNELTEPMIEALRVAARGEQPKPGASRKAIQRRGLIVFIGPNEVMLTDAGRVALDGLRFAGAEGVPQVAATDHTHEFLGDPERWCLKHVTRPDGRIEQCNEPIKGAIHDPQAYSAYHAEVTEALAELRPSVLLSPSNEPAEVPDAELLQLLALLDSGVRITRRLYQAWQVSGSAITLDPVKVDRAAREAIRTGLASWTTGNAVKTLRAEPIHLLARGRDGMEAVCKRRLRRAGGQRLRYTTDASKATHEACVNPRKRHPAPASFKVNDVVRFRHNGAETGRLFRVVETDGTDGDMVRVAWDNPPEDCTEEINARWVGIGMVEHEPNA